MSKCRFDTGVIVRDVSLDPAAVPVAVRSLIPLAERWGIGDDYDRSLAVESATPEDQQALITALAAAPDDLWKWLLAGPQTPEWAAFTSLTMAADEARVIVGK